MAKKPTSKDAELILKLYELRQEPELRRARSWFLATFWPETAADYQKIEMSVGSQENNWLRQVVSYWGMAAALVLHGTLPRDLFLEPACSGEMFFYFAKVAPLPGRAAGEDSEPGFVCQCREGDQGFEGRPRPAGDRRKEGGGPQSRVVSESEGDLGLTDPYAFG